MRRTRGLSLLLGAGLLGLTGAVAADNFTVTPGVTAHVFDSDRDAEDSPGLRLGLGYQWGENWQIEAVLGGTNTETDDAGGDLDIRYGQVDWLYHFQPQSQWQPYIVGGIGYQEEELDALGEEESSTANIGAGLWYDQDSWFMRADVRRVHVMDNDFNDNVVTVGVGWKFGESEEPAPAPEPEPAPEPADSDNDGVVNERDECPNTPAGVEVDNRGCPLDQDQDGVPDHRDECPNTPRGARVDDQGCQIILKEDVSMTLDVQFPFNSAEVREEYFDEIEEVAQFMREYPSTETTIEGHSDSTGPEEYNQQLSQKRAEAVRQVLIDRFGVDPSRLDARGYGESRPIESNATEEGRQANRRVVAVLKATKTTALTQDDELPDDRG